jgi:hypothetical protein
MPVLLSIERADFETRPCGLMQKYIKAVEEAQEIQDRRNGKQPKTDHDPIDFLDPSTFPSSDSEDDDSDEAPSPKVDMRPDPLMKEGAELVAPNQALNFLQAAARGDSEALTMVSLHLDANWCLCHALLKF